MRRRDVLKAALAASLLPRLAPAQELMQHLDTPQDLGTPLEALDKLLTPSEVFFVRSHFGPPALNRSRRLRIEGRTIVDLGVDDLRALPQATATVVLQCAGNGRALQRPRVPGVQWVHGAMGQAEWTGVRLRDLLEKAGVPDGALHVRFQGADNAPKPAVPKWIRSLPIEKAMDERTLVAWSMNGEPLSLAHGAPLRLVVPGWAGDHWMKWLTSARLQREEAEGFYMRTGYKAPKQPIAPGAAVKPEEMESVTVVPVKSVIARPADGARLSAGPQEIAGVAFSGAAAIARVEVSVDGGASWAAAELEGEPGAGRWVVFRHRFRAAPGPLRVLARATDARGATQPQAAVWNPSGYLWNAWHAVSCEVRS